MAWERINIWEKLVGFHAGSCHFVLGPSMCYKLEAWGRDNCWSLAGVGIPHWRILQGSWATVWTFWEWPITYRSRHCGTLCFRDRSHAVLYLNGDCSYRIIGSFLAIPNHLCYSKAAVKGPVVVWIFKMLSLMFFGVFLPPESCTLNSRLEFCLSSPINSKNSGLEL